MSQSASAAIDRWADVVMGRAERYLSASNIMTSGDRIYSYGSHFELARPLRDKKGEIEAFLLNGDTYSNTTSGHQSDVRGTLSRRTSRPIVIIPHEALGGAGIDLDSIKVVHVLPDRWETTNHRTTEMPPGAAWYNHPIHETRDKSDAAIGAILTKKHAEAIAEWERHRRWHREALEKGDESRAKLWARDAAKPMPTRPSRHVLNGSSYYYTDSLREQVTVGYDRKLYTRKDARGAHITVQELPDGTKEYLWETSRHWLGESLIRAKVEWSTLHTCQFCDGTGLTYGPRRHEWDRGQCRACFNGRVSRPHHRWAYYLSGFDHAEARPLYFLCELPRGAKPATVAEAYEALKPEPVKMAEQMGRPIERQGDIFAIPTELDRKVLRAQGARIVRRNMNINSAPDRPIELPYILNTNHTATEVAYLPNGVTLARGTMYHDPADRQQDHARHKLGDGKVWHIVVKNTVPTTVRR